MYPITGDPQTAIAIARRQTVERVQAAEASRRAREVRAAAERRSTRSGRTWPVPVPLFVARRWANAN